ncbi:MAG: hypothetical protein ACI9IV_000503 [Paracoccaceae bacterium]|jgi:hypothetical protein
MHKRPSTGSNDACRVSGGGQALRIVAKRQKPFHQRLAAGLSTSWRHALPRHRREGECDVQSSAFL